MSEITWGVSYGHHDAALTVVKGKELVYASHSERYSRIKNDPNLHPLQLTEALHYGQPDKVFYYENSWLKKTRYLRSGEWFRFKDSPKKTLTQLFKDQKLDFNRTSFHEGRHHLSHAAAGFYTNTFSDGLILVCDAIGEIDTLVIYQAVDGVIQPKPVFKLKYPHSVGLFYSAVTKAVGLKPNEEEYILMGMAAYGDPNKHREELLQFIQFGEDFHWKALLNAHLGLPIKVLAPEADSAASEQDRMDWAASAQSLVEDYIFRVFSQLQTLFPQNRNWMFCGGVALNCVLNSKLVARLPVGSNLSIFPNPGDAGSSLGAALSGLQQKLLYRHAFWGTNIPAKENNSVIAESLVQNKVIGLARGRAEFGPRALGNRSLLADPRGPEVKDLVNEIKRRQKFRPFAAAILEEFTEEYFELPKNIKHSPFMQFVAKVKRPDLFPAISHFDQTSRIQTVSPRDNPEFYALIHQFYKLTGCPMLLNTSLNIRGQPLVNDEKDRDAFASQYKIPVFS
jgi:carbamoyltransferase